MRFITEFELNHPYTPTRENNSKKEMQEGMGKMIGESFGWKEKSDVAFTRHTLEIEAFPMKDYLAFKENIINYLTNIGVNPKVIKDRFDILESIGKPSGDTITNLPDLEYRGPSSHCKACETEKNGVKHIMAQKHTCNK